MFVNLFELVGYMEHVWIQSGQLSLWTEAVSIEYNGRTVLMIVVTCGVVYLNNGGGVGGL